MVVRDAKGRSGIWGWSWQVVQDDTRSLMIFMRCSRDRRDVSSRVGRTGQQREAALGPSIQVGSPGGDGQLHGLVFRGGDQQVPRERYSATMVMVENQAKREGCGKGWSDSRSTSHTEEAEQEGISGGKEWPLNVKCDRGSTCLKGLAIGRPPGSLSGAVL